MIDLHVHSTFSDGTLTPTEIIHLAKETKLTAVSITDHDRIDGLFEAQEMAAQLDVRFINGIEFSVSCGEDRILHILGLGIDPNNKIFMDIYTKYREVRSNKLTHVFEKLNNMGVEIEPVEVEPYISGGYMDRQAIARCIMGKGYVDVIKFAWINYLDKIPHIEGELIKPEAAFTAIHAAGGKTFLAHFHLPIGLKGYSEQRQLEILKDLKEKGLDGMELYYPSFTKEDIKRCQRYVDQLGFITSGGSDFHGANRPHIKLGVGEGNFEVPDELLDHIYQTIKKITY